MLKIWSSWEKYVDHNDFTCKEFLTLFVQRDNQDPWNCAIAAESLVNPEMILSVLNSALTEMINKSYPEYWSPIERACRRQKELLKELDEVTKFIKSLDE